MQRVFPAELGETGGHRHDRRDADAAGYEDIGLARLIEREVVAGRRGVEDVADPETVVQEGGATQALLLAQNTNDVTMGLAAIVEQ